MSCSFVSSRRTVAPDLEDRGRIKRLSMALCTAARGKPVTAAASAGVYPSMPNSTPVGVELLQLDRFPPLSRRAFRNPCPSRAREPITSAVLLAGVAQAPDRLVAIVGDVQRAVPADRDTHRTSPGLTLRRDKARKKIFVSPTGVTVLQWHTHDFVTRPNRVIP